MVNAGSATAYGVVVSFRLPPGFTSVIARGCSLRAGTTTTYDCPVGDLAEGEEVSVVAAFDVPPDFVPAGQGIRVSAGEGPADFANPQLVSVFPLERPTSLPSLPCGAGCIQGRSTGDPHLVTFDGAPYDLQSIGEFTWARSDDGQLLVQNRTRAAGSSVAVNDAVAVLVNGHTVEIRSDGRVFQDGEAVQVQDQTVLDLGDGAFVDRTGGTYTIVWPGAGDRPVLTIRVARRLDLSMKIPPSMAGQLSGLLGDADGDSSNDFALSDGTVLAQPVTAESLHVSFGGSWRITDEDSLFTYPANQGTADYTNLDFPSAYLSLADFDPAVVAAARIQCEQAGVTHPVVRDSCALDLIVTQDPSFLAAFLGAVLPTGLGPLNTIRTADGLPLQLVGVTDIATSNDGTVLYGSIPAENKIVAIDPITGTVADFATTEAPTDLDIDAAGNIYALSAGDSPGSANGAVTKIDPSGGTQTVVHEGLAGPIEFEVTPDGSYIYVHITGVNYFGSPKAHAIQLIDVEAGTRSTLQFGRRLDRFSGLVLDGNGRASWFDGAGGDSVRYQTWWSHTVEGGLVNHGKAGGPWRDAIAGPDGTLYSTVIGGVYPGACDSRNSASVWTVQVDEAGAPSGDPVTVAGGSAGFADSSFDNPRGAVCFGINALALNGNRLYINDPANQAIRYVSVR